MSDQMEQGPRRFRYGDRAGAAAHRCEPRAILPADLQADARRARNVGRRARDEKGALGPTASSFTGPQARAQACASARSARRDNIVSAPYRDERRFNQLRRPQAVLNGLRIAALDLYRKFVACGGPKNARWKHDCHGNETGLRWAAEALYQYLDAPHMLDPAAPAGLRVRVAQCPLSLDRGYPSPDAIRPCWVPSTGKSERPTPSSEWRILSPERDSPADRQGSHPQCPTLVMPARKTLVP